MIFIFCFLIALRMMIWRWMPQYGIAEMSDIVFGAVALTLFVLYKLSKSHTPFAWPVGIWLAASAMSFFHSVNPIISLKSWYLMTIYVFGFALIVTHVKTRFQFRCIWGTIILFAIVSALMGIKEFVFMHTGVRTTENPTLQMIFEMRRACSLQGWPTSFAGFLILIVPTVAMMYGKCFGWKKWFLSTGLFILGLGLVSSKTVLAPLSLLLAFAIVAESKVTLWLVWMIIGSMWLTLPDKSFSGFMSTRIGYYQTVFDMILRHPFTGSGLSSFSSGGNSPSVFAHNSYLQVWAETGWLGFLGIIGLFATFFELKPLKQFPLQVALFTGLLAVFIDNVFSFTILKPNLSFVWWVALALYSNLRMGRIQ